jgi:cytochrome c oxidase subunit II
VTALIATTRDDYQHLFGIYWPIGVAIFAIVAGTIVYVAVRFRSSERRFPQGRDERRSLELGWLGVVAAIVALLLAFTYTSMDDLQAFEEARGGPLVEVTAAKWNWRFDYPRAGVSQVGGDRRPTTLVVPVDTPVRFRGSSVDVIHAFWIPELRFKRDLFPDRRTDFVLSFPNEGFLRQGGECNQFCGLLHATMTFNVRVVSRARFERWLDERR